MAPVWRVPSFCLEGEICLDSKTTTFSAGIGGNIKTLRMRKQLTQKDLAAVLGISPQAVSRWEHGITCPDIFSLPMLARLLDVTVDSLLNCE